ncbi:MAG: DegV family protein [Lachnospiraceae bacterium]|nr:DegV family protein [Lachnospiraceae bacterium]
MSVAILTDSNSGITMADAEKLGVHVIPMPLYINDKLYFEDLTLSQEQFYEFLEAGAAVHTSMPAPGDVMDMWDKLLAEYDEIVHIPMSSGLSSACENEIILARDEKYEGRVFVVDNQRISVTMKQSVIDAKALADKGFSGKEIAETLYETGLDASIYITVATMEYLKKGGRVTAAAAGIATILNIKPVLQIQGGKLDQFTKPRGMKAAKKDMKAAIRMDLDGRFAKFLKENKMGLYIAYTKDKEAAEAFAEELKAEFPEISGDIMIDPLSLSVSCHIGPGALAVAASRIIDENDIVK